jgi:hypothetical protein
MNKSQESRAKNQDKKSKATYIYHYISVAGLKNELFHHNAIFLILGSCLLTL